MSAASKYVIEVQRRDGHWEETQGWMNMTQYQCFRYACALGRWIGVAAGNVTAVRVRPNKP
jgi:hypothetical protein